MTRPPLDSSRSEPPDDDLRRAEEMVDAIKEGAAERAKHLQPGQCPSCGAYRLDGKPPQIHEPGCQWEGDTDPFDYLQHG